MFSVGFFASLIQSLVGTWNPSDKSATVTLSNGNLTMANSSASNVSVRSTNSISTGLDYVEWTINGGTQVVVGVGTSTAALGGFPGSDANGVGYYGIGGGVYKSNTQQGSVLATFGAGDVIGAKIDRTNGTIAFNKNNGTFSGTYALPTGAVFLMASSISPNGCTLNLVPVYAIPSGYVYWGN